MMETQKAKPSLPYIPMAVGLFILMVAVSPVGATLISLLGNNVIAMLHGHPRIESNWVLDGMQGLTNASISGDNGEIITGDFVVGNRISLQQKIVNNGEEIDKVLSIRFSSEGNPLTVEDIPQVYHSMDGVADNIVCQPDGDDLLCTQVVKLTPGVHFSTLEFLTSNRFDYTKPLTITKN